MAISKEYWYSLSGKIYSELKEISNVWAFDKDGKIYDPEMSKKLMRK